MTVGESRRDARTGLGREVCSGGTAERQGNNIKRGEGGEEGE